MGDVFDSGGDGIPGSERGVSNNTEAFHLEVSFVQSLERASIIKVMVERDSKVGVHDGSDKDRMLSRGRE